jgi:sugar phosphate isomerase/epimerase
MKRNALSRRSAFAKTGLLLGGAVAATKLSQVNTLGTPAETAMKTKPFISCLNTATIRGQKLGIVKEIEIASKAGFEAIEPWIESLNDYVKKGGSLKDLAQRIKDSGLTVESAIGFPQWIVDDETRRQKGLDQAKHEMEMVAQIGGKRLAAPPAGATDAPNLDWRKAAERYRALLEIGDQTGIVPQLELWGFSKNLNRLGECVCVAMETGHPKACVLADVYHLYKGGSDWRGIRLLSGEAIQVLHMNDYPAEPPREKINDSYRVLPGDGTAPITEILTALHKTGGQKVLSLEIFNQKYWAEDALSVAKMGVAKLKQAVAQVSI